VEQVRCVLDSKALVGESPRWNPVDQALWWVDIYEPSLNRFDPVSGKARKYAMPEHIGCFSFTRSGQIIARIKAGIASMTAAAIQAAVSGPAVSWKGWSAGSARYTASIPRDVARN
jgi:sugar lactone lactonase YvrE